MMKTWLSIFVALLAVVCAVAQPVPPTAQIRAALSTNGPLEVGQSFTVTVTMNSYTATTEIESFNFVVTYDHTVLAYVPGSFSIGDASGPNQQWLTKPPQETVAQGLVLTNVSNPEVPGYIFVAVGDMGGADPQRGTLAASGFLVSFQLQAIGPGASGVTLGPAWSGSVLLDTSLRPAVMAEFANASVVVRNPTTVKITASDATASESASNTAAIVFARTGPTNQAVEVYFDLSGTASYASDYSISSLSPITISSGASNATLVITPVDDEEQESSETVMVTLASNLYYEIGSPNTATININDNENIPPSAALTSPAQGSIFTSPTNINLTATASDADGSVSLVEFFTGSSTNKIGEDSVSPYSITWSNVPAGQHQLTAVAHDNLGAVTTSAPISIVVRGAPAVTITSPTNGAVFRPPGGVPIIATAADPDGAVLLLSVYQNDKPLFSVAGSELTHSWLGAVPTNYTLTARATDDRGLISTSAPVSITIGASVFEDYFSNRVFLAGVTNFATGNNSSYSKETGETQHAERNGDHSAWIAWTAPLTAQLTIDTEGSSFDTVLAVYTNKPSGLESVTNLGVAAYSDDANGSVLWSKVMFQATAGRTYQIAVDGYAANVVGDIVLHLAQANSIPRILTQPNSALATVGDTVSFSVTATGSIATLNYQWRSQGTNLPSYSPANSFTRTNVQASHAGVYDVVVSDNSGNAVTSAPAVMVVREMPSITNGPATQIVDAGNNATFTVAAIGTAPLSYQWKSNGVLIAGAIYTSYTHYNAQHSDTGIFSATIENGVGSTSASAELIVRPRFSSVALSNMALTLFWNGTPSRAYFIESTSGLETSAPPWSALATVTNTAVPAQWSLPATNLPGQFLRLRRVE